MSSDHILVLDDEREILAIFAGIGRRLGRPVQCWEHPRRFLDEFACKDYPQATLILDLDLPDIDGIEVLRHLADYRCKLGIIFVSGSAPRVLKSAIELGKLHGMRVIGALSKPFLVDEAIRLLEEREEDAWQSAARAERGAAAVDSVSEQRLRQALAAGEIIPHYQPQFSADEGRIVGFEALARWENPEEGTLGPARFLPGISKNGMLADLTEAIVRRGLVDFQSWNARRSGLRISFNIDPRSLHDLSLPEALSRTLAEHGISPGQVVLEVTEAAMIEVPQVALDILARLALHGFGLALDDFGTGWSSHDQLRKIPLDEIKIDRSFVTDCLRSADAWTILSSIVGLGQRLELRIVAEGVETKDELEAVKGLGCHVIQGYYYSPPVPPAKIDLMLSSGEDRGRGSSEA